MEESWSLDARPQAIYRLTLRDFRTIAAAWQRGEHYRLRFSLEVEEAMNEILTRVMPALESNVVDPSLEDHYADDVIFGRSRIYWQEDMVWLRACRSRLARDLERSERWLERLSAVIDLLNYILHGPNEYRTAEHCRNALAVLREGIFHWLMRTRDSFSMLSAYEELNADDRL